MNINQKNYLIDLIFEYAQAMRLEGASYVVESGSSSYKTNYKKMKKAEERLQKYIESV